MTQEEIYRQEYPYRELVGSLHYLVSGTRPDIANAVRTLSKFLTCYNKSHWQAGLRVLKYLKGSSDYGLVYNGANKNVVYDVYTDASFGNADENRKSVSGYLIKIAGATISCQIENIQNYLLHILYLF